MEEVIDFLVEIGKLKKTERTGWVAEGVKDPESVADHLFRTAVAVLVLGEGRKDIDVNKCLKMALVHDMAESQTGDVLVDWKVKGHGKKMERLAGNIYHGITQEEKEKKELDGIKKLASILGENGSGILDLWKEYEKRETNESKFVKSVELFEMFLQAWEYEKSQPGIEIDWFNDTQNWEKIKDDRVKKLILKIMERRKSGPDGS